jgi:predicted DNA-binding antitoxin AbrB/MazE fold protein
VAWQSIGGFSTWGYAKEEEGMSQIVAATFEGGVFKPDQPPSLPDNTRVRLLVETIDGDSDPARREQAWASLVQLWQKSTFDSHGDRHSRDELHVRG